MTTSINLEVKAYSPKGLVVRHATQEQARAIAARLGANVCTSYNEKEGGWSFSRKREDKIKAIVSEMVIALDDLPGKWGALAD